MKKFIEKIVHFFTPELPQSEQVPVPGNITTLQVRDSGKFRVILVDAGENKINVIQKIREITGLGLKEGKDLSDNGGMLAENLSFEEANRIKQDLESVGATVVIE